MTDQEWAEKIKQWVDEAKRLRSNHVEAECAFFAHLANGEQTLEWQRTGVRTFDDLLANENLVEPQRYRRYLAVVARVGIDEVRANGVDAVSEVLRIPEDAQSRVYPNENAGQAFIRDLAEFRIKNRTPPSEHVAEQKRQKHYVPEKIERVPVNESYDKILRERNALLREKEAWEKREQGYLETIAALKATLGRERPGGAKTAGTARTAKSHRKSAAAGIEKSA